MAFYQIFITFSVNQYHNQSLPFQVHSSSLSSHHPTVIHHIVHRVSLLINKPLFFYFPIYMLHQRFSTAFRTKFNPLIVAYEGVLSTSQLCFQPTHGADSLAISNYWEVLNSLFLASMMPHMLFPLQHVSSFLSLLFSLFWHHLLQEAFPHQAELFPCPSSQQYLVHMSVEWLVCEAVSHSTP